MIYRRQMVCLRYNKTQQRKVKVKGFLSSLLNASAKGVTALANYGHDSQGKRDVMIFYPSVVD